MIQYCINNILCLGLLFFLYRILLEKEKMNGFKRFYLLTAVLISLISPLNTLSFKTTEQIIAHDYLVIESADLIVNKINVTPEKTTSVFITMLFVLYLAGFTYNLIRLIYSIIQIIAQKKNSEVIAFEKTKLILLNKKVLPHSFLNNIFLNKEDYEKGKIEREVLVHELAHVNQYHSWDILLIKTIHCIFWFNPFYFLILKAVQLNHEFLADDLAVNASKDSLSYQQLLLYKVSENRYPVTSPFHYSTIQKRLVMITTNTPQKTRLGKQLLSIALFVISLFLFSAKEILAQDTEPQKNKTEIPHITQGASTAEINEYETIVKNHRSEIYNGSLSKENKESLFAIYSKMSKEQQEKQSIGFTPRPLAKRGKVSTSEQLQTWTDSKKYFVRINGRKVDNSILENKIASDLIIFEYYKPNKGSADYGKYEAQINLMTKDEYARYVQSWNEGEPYFLVVFKNR